MAKGRLVQLEVHWAEHTEGVTTLERRVPEHVLEDDDALHEWVRNNVTDAELQENADDASSSLEVEEVHEVS